MLTYSKYPKIKKNKNYSAKLLTLILAICITTVSSLSGCHKISEDSTGLPQNTSSVTSADNTDSSDFTSQTSLSSQTEQLTESTLSETSVPDNEVTLKETLQAENPVDAEFAAVGSSETSKNIKNTKSETSNVASESLSETQPAVTSSTKIETTIVSEQASSELETVLGTSVEVEEMYFASNNYNAVNYSEQKGFWFTYLEFGNILKNKTKAQFKSSIGEYFDNIKSIGFNTVYVQVRAFGDAYYDSELFPATDNFNGQIDTIDKFDALDVMIDAAHDRGLSIHAWVNPMRLMTDTQLKSLSDTYLVKKWYNSDKHRGAYIVKSGDRWYLNPAYSSVTTLIADGISEIVSNYDVDGIQIDDYFYPTVDSGFDKKAFSASGTSLSLSKWRINNINTMVKKLYKAAHKANSSISFGISPQGSVENNYDELYADVKTWCSQSGYCDYILPQVYFGFNNVALPYDKTIKQWQNMVTCDDVQLVIGLAAYKIGAVDNYAGAGAKNEWTNNSDIIARQMKSAEKLENYGGVAIYRYESLFKPASDVSSQVSKELKNIKK